MIPKLSADQQQAPNEGALLLDELDELFERFVAFPSIEARWAVVLWVMHTHCIDAFESTPRLALLSPEKGSGKTRVLEILALVVPDPLHTVNISAAALFRIVDDQQPTLLLDEADTYLGPTVAKQHEDLRGLINAGHRRGAVVYRGEVSGKAVKVVDFKAFAAAALAGIGDLPDTIIDRSIVIPMKRRAPNEIVEPFRERKHRPETSELRARLEQWGEASVAELTDAWPQLPPGIVDRPADVWEPLCAIGDICGSTWAQRSRQATVVINNARLQRDPSWAVQLLTDCQRIFNERNVDRLTTETLIEQLIAITESPWGDMRGTPLDARKLARMLRKYDVKPADHRFGNDTRKGYTTEAFHDAWSRYLTPVAPVAHVAPNQGYKGAGGDVAPTEDEVGYVIPSKTNNVNASSPMQGQQGQQGQHPSSTPTTIDTQGDLF